MPDILMYTDMSRYNEQVRLKSVHLSKLNEIKDAYNSMDIGEVTATEFKSLVLNPASFIFDKMTNGQAVVIGGLKVNKTKAIEILEKPEGYDVLKNLITNFQNTVQNWNEHLSSIDIDAENGEVIIAQSVLDAEMEASKIYAVTDDEKAAYDIAQTLKALWEEKFAGQRMPGFSIINRLVRLETHPFNSLRIEDQAIVINAVGIKHISFGSSMI